MLLAGLKRKHICCIALAVGGLAYYAAGQLTHVLCEGSHKAEIWAAVGKRHTERLTFAYRYIRAAVLGGLHYRKRYWVAAHYIHRSGGVHHFAYGRRVLQLPEEAGLLDIYGGHVFGEHLTESGHIGLAVLHWYDAHLIAGAVAVSAYGVYGIRV